MENTHAKADSGYTVEIIQLFRALRAVEADRFQQVCYCVSSLSLRLLTILNYSDCSFWLYETFKLSLVVFEFEEQDATVAWITSY